ncbi:MAG: glycerol kinase [Planctomycetota bacterium]|nr:MAG: glycerol kinase [Planctomycetota bacterium]
MDGDRGSDRDCVLALDQGTTSSRAILFDRRGLPVATAQEEFPQHLRNATAAGDGGTGPEADLAVVEHDPEDLWRTQLGCARDVVARAGLAPARLAAIGITNQRETTILWDRVSGQPVSPAIVWQSRVSAGICQRLKNAGLEEEVRRRTGLLLDPYFSATKIMHLLETMPGLRVACEAGRILFGTVDTFLIWRLTGGRVHATDPTNASRTLLYDIDRLEWSDDLCRLFDVPRAILPEVRPSSGDFGTTDAGVFGAAVRIAGCAGDQQAAGFAHGCVLPGTAKNTYGTGAFLLFSTGTQRPLAAPGLLATVGCGAVPGSVSWCLEGSVFIAGAIVGWLRDGLGIIERAADIEPLARSVPDTGGVVLVPALAGLGTPHWDPTARGLIIGLTRATTRAHIARAALEAIALSVADVVRAIEGAAGVPLQSLRVDGGASGNDLLLQIQADVLDRPVERPVVLETTALGAALLAGLASGFYPSAAAVAEARRVERVFTPTIDAAVRRRMTASWDDAVGRAGRWAVPRG